MPWHISIAQDFKSVNIYVHVASSETSGITSEGEGSSGESFSEGAAGNEVAAADPVVDDTALAPLDAGPLALAARSALPTSQYLTLESEVETQRPPWSGVSIIFSTGADSRKTSARFPSRRRSCQKTCASRPDEYTFKRK